MTPLETRQSHKVKLAARTGRFDVIFPARLDETAVARAGLQRLEGSTYEVQDGDIVAVRFNK